MAETPARNKISSYTYQMGMGCLKFRLEYHPEENMQFVILNDQLVSSIACPPGMRAVHSFTETLSSKPDMTSTSYYRVHFATEESTYNIRFQMLHRFGNSGWLAIDTNIDKELLAK